MERDSTWDAFAISKDPKEFAAEIFPDIKLKEEVHEDIKDSFRVIKKLIEQSYFEYQFYDKAATDALLTLEMALRIRNRELNFVKTEKYEPSLSKLITVFHKQGYFETGKSFLDYLRRARNQFVHRDKNNFAGPIKRQFIFHAIDVINGLYEDPKLRRKRLGIWKILLEGFMKIGQNGFRVIFDNEEYDCFTGWFSFVNNKKCPYEIYFYFKPTYHIPTNFMEEKKLYESPTYYIVANSFKIKPDCIVLCDCDETYTISAYGSTDHQNKFNSWMQLFNEYSNFTGELGMIRNEMSDCFSKHLRELHLM